MNAGDPRPAARAERIFPGGSNGEFDLPPGAGIVIRRGEGCRLWDADGRAYLDFSMGWGSALPGHAHPAVAEAVGRAARDGLNFAFVTETSLELAETLIALSPACEQIRFCASGTEATMYCLRIARAATGRPAVLKFEYAYHGGHDTGVISLFPKQERPHPESEPSSDGLESSAAAQTLVAPFNDLAATEQIVRAHAGRLACVIVEPLHRCLPPAPGFLEGLRRVCDTTGVLLVFDEVVTGFRLAYGGAQERYGVVPDLVAYGKALGGGCPIGAFGGPRGLMDLAREARAATTEPYVWTASTLGGNPVSAAGALAALALYREPGTYERLYALGDALRQGMREALAARGLDACVLGDGPLAQVAFVGPPLRSYRDVTPEARARGRALMLALVQEGIFLNPMGTKLYLSLAHDAPAVESFLQRLRRALEVVQQQGVGPLAEPGI